MKRNKEKAEFGDFQTPSTLAKTVCEFLARDGLQPAALLEPTCGVGNFLFAAMDRFKSIQQVVGADIKAEHVGRASQILNQRQDHVRARLIQADFFATDWRQVIGELPEPILVLGNPPWVTNAHLGVLGSTNLPVKANFHKFRGLDAITGKANFDISEWMLIRLLEGMNSRCGTLAMLCKSSTARKVLGYAWKNGIALERSRLYGIDADLHFDAAVNAVLFVAHFRRGAHHLEAEVFGNLGDTCRKARSVWTMGCCWRTLPPTIAGNTSAATKC